MLGPADIAEVRVGPIESTIAIQGDLQPLESVVVRARIDGDVVAVNVREGDRVVRGQTMAQFESS
ncbi:MAG TPA: biotin/lipoyl-binding protein, partial [Gemmatimonadaceae bacterium]|nr:biotin/lipoyl-binding protein [Gemmatimonadaceae bacterium]